MRKANKYIDFMVNQKRGKIAYLLLTLALIPRLIWVNKNNLPKSSLLGFDINNLFSLDPGSININFLKLWFLISTFVIVSIFELLRNDKIASNINLISIFRVRQSEGNKFADIWYFFLRKITFHFKTFTVFGSLGIAGVSDSFSNLLNSIFDKIVPFGFDSGYLILILFIGMLFHDFSTYVSHRLSHIFFWELHEFHHSATEMNIFNLYRASVLEVTLMALIVLPINLLPLSIMNKALAEGQWLVFITYLLAYNLVGQFFSYLGHSSVKIIFPKPISYLFLSPSLHWLHHSDNPDHYGKNFGSIFTIWDKAFGTYLDESHLKDIKSFGVKNSEYNKHHPLYSFYILPVIKLIKKYRNYFKTKSIA